MHFHLHYMSPLYHFQFHICNALLTFTWLKSFAYSGYSVTCEFVIFFYLYTHFLMINNCVNVLQKSVSIFLSYGKLNINNVALQLLIVRWLQKFKKYLFTEITVKFESDFLSVFLVQMLFMSNYFKIFLWRKKETTSA